jgi:hypothetical protein
MQYTVRRRERAVRKKREWNGNKKERKEALDALLQNGGRKGNAHTETERDEMEKVQIVKSASHFK